MKKYLVLLSFSLCSLSVFSQDQFDMGIESPSKNEIIYTFSSSKTIDEATVTAFASNLDEKEGIKDVQFSSHRVIVTTSSEVSSDDFYDLLRHAGIRFRMVK